MLLRAALSIIACSLPLLKSLAPGVVFSAMASIGPRSSGPAILASGAAKTRGASRPAAAEAATEAIRARRWIIMNSWNITYEAEIVPGPSVPF